MHLTIAEMPIVPLFLFKLSVSLAVVWLFYHLVLRRMTFHSFNRWYLLGYTTFSFLIPFINIGPMLPESPAGEPVMLQYIPAMGGVVQRTGAGVSSASSAGVSAWTVMLWVLAAGAMLMLAKVAVQWISLLRLRTKARLIGGMGVKVYQVDRPIIPFSFGNAIYINQGLHSEKEWEDIILHEYVHIRQRHTVDILLAEIVCIINWYNPFAWLIRYSIRQNLEFIADQQVLENGADRKGYQYHLLKVVGEPRYRLANQFNFSSLKKRIVMMNKGRSGKAHLLKLLFLLPLVTVLLVAFRDRYPGLPRSHGQVYVNAAGIVITSSDRKPVEGAVVRDTVTGLQTTTDARGFYKLQIPVRTSPVNVCLTYKKSGYDGDFHGRSIPKLEETIGLLDVGLLRQVNRIRSNTDLMFVAPSFEKAPSDPDFGDAYEEMKRALKTMDNLNRYMQLKKDHPEVGLFYVTEDRRKEIVIYMDGTVGRYGYPGTPGLEELYKKFGEIDGFMASDHPEGHLANSGYLARWAAIGEQAQREFRPTGANVRAVIFPGDSRVIGVPVSGKPKVYDMDNDAAVERAEFEQLYGKLPDCVPKAGNNTDERERAARGPEPRAGRVTQGGGAVAAVGRGTVVRDADGGGAPGKDTVPVGRKDSSRGASVGAVKLHLDTARRHEQHLFLVDGREVSQDSLNNLYPDQIESVTVLKDSVTVKKYGEKGKDGVILVKLKDHKEMQRPVKLDWGPKTEFQPIWVVDGKEEPKDSLQTLNPDRIKAIQVLKDSMAVKMYGERGKNGVVIITLK